MSPDILKFIIDQRTAKFTRSVWFYGEELDVYLRAGEYHLNLETKQYQFALGISNVNKKPDAAKGSFKKLITALECYGKELGYDVLRVEEVRNRTLFQGLRTHGYVLRPGTDLDPTLVRELQTVNY